MFNSLWDVIWTMFVAFAFIAYLIAMFSVVTDLFRDRDLKGWLKAVWVFFLIFLPFLTVLVYLIARGEGMARRQAAQVRASQDAADDYIRTVAGSSPADDIIKAKQLLDSGAITEDEYATLKAKALAAA